MTDGDNGRPTGYHGELLDLIKLLRSRWRGTDRALAQKIDMSAGYLSEILCGKKIPSEDMAAAVVKALGGDEPSQRRARDYARFAHAANTPAAALPLGEVPTLPTYVPATLALSGEPVQGDSMPLRDLAGGSWQGGVEVLVKGNGYLVHDPVPAEVLAADRSVVWREAVAERLAPQAGLVVLRQVAELAGTRTRIAGQWRAAAEAEGRLLADLEQVRGLPRLLDVDVSVGAVTVVTAQPRAATWRAVYGPDGVPLDLIRATRLLRAVRSLCSALERLHGRGRAHRALTPDAVLVTDRDGSMAVRTLGLATMAPAAGEGPAEYRAPEQDRPLGLGEPPGPRTDIYRLAAMLYQTLTGNPAGPHCPPVSVAVPGLPGSVDEVLTRALDQSPANRPRSMRALAAGLRAERR